MVVGAIVGVPEEETSSDHCKVKCSGVSVECIGI